MLARMAMKCRLNVWIARSISLVGSFRVRWDKFVSDIVGGKVLSQGFGSFVVHDLEPDEMVELVEPLVRAGICVYNGCF